MDHIDTLIAQFRAEQTDSLENIDSSKKRGLVMKLEEFVDDERVNSLFISVAGNEQEYDLGRIEIFKVFRLTQYAAPVRTRIARVVAKVLEKCPDDLVRCYAAMAATNFLDFPEVREAVDKVLHNRREDLDLRWNAFGALEGGGPSPESISSLKKLIRTKEFGFSVKAAFEKWGYNVRGGR